MTGIVLVPADTPAAAPIQLDLGATISRTPLWDDSLACTLDRSNDVEGKSNVLENDVPFAMPDTLTDAATDSALPVHLLLLFVIKQTSMFSCWAPGTSMAMRNSSSLLWTRRISQFLVIIINGEASNVKPSRGAVSNDEGTATASLVAAEVMHERG